MKKLMILVLMLLSVNVFALNPKTKQKIGKTDFIWQYELMGKKQKTKMLDYIKSFDNVIEQENSYFRLFNEPLLASVTFAYQSGMITLTYSENDIMYSISIFTEDYVKKVLMNKQTIRALKDIYHYSDEQVDEYFREISEKCISLEKAEEIKSSILDFMKAL